MKKCQEITNDIERAKFEQLSGRERFSLRAHLMICKHCRNFLKDSRLIDKILVRKYKHLGDYKFTNSEKVKLKSEL